MIIVQNATTACAVCGNVPAVIFCDGCHIPLCRECRKFDLWGYGCGHVDTKAFCAACFKDININPYGGSVHDANDSTEIS